MMKLTKHFQTLSIIAAVLTLSACAGVETSKYSYTGNQALNYPSKSDDCYDAAILVGKNIVEAKQISLRVLAALDTSIEKDESTAIKASRNRHIGLLVGSGGEEIFVNLKDVAKDRTFITITTKTGFVGGAGQKAWSCQVVDEVAKQAQR